MVLKILGIVTSYINIFGQNIITWNEVERDLIMQNIGAPRQVFGRIILCLDIQSVKYIITAYYDKNIQR
jgi:hypothetical protein